MKRLVIVVGLMTGTCCTVEGVCGPLYKAAFPFPVVRACMFAARKEGLMATESTIIRKRFVRTSGCEDRVLNGIAVA